MLSNNRHARSLYSPLVIPSRAFTSSHPSACPLQIDWRCPSRSTSARPEVSLLPTAARPTAALALLDIWAGDDLPRTGRCVAPTTTTDSRAPYRPDLPLPPSHASSVRCCPSLISSPSLQFSFPIWQPTLLCISSPPLTMVRSKVGQWQRDAAGVAPAVHLLLRWVASECWLSTVAHGPRLWGRWPERAMGCACWSS
jgi:hypothetical protein